jgi:transposase InsO family protein
MAWGLLKVEEQRKALVDAYFKGTASMSELCYQFGVSRKTAYKWCNRYKSLGIEGLKDHSKAPHNRSVLYNREIIDMAIDLKLKKRNWGPKKILAALKAKYPRIEWPCPTRLYEIFKANCLIVPRRLRTRVPATHPLRECNDSNDVWMADFKGWFLTGDGTKCEPLTITDGFSRFLLKCVHTGSKSWEYVWPIFEEAFKVYGLPNRIRTDNGPPFGSVGAGRLTSLSIKLIKSGVIPEWINPGHPEENGRHERFHLTLKESTANTPAHTLEEQIQRMLIFQEEYNYERPHEALGMATPSDLYCRSSRKWDGILRSPEYDTQEVLVRKVGQSGTIWIKQTEYYLSQTLSGEYVGIKETDEGLEASYGPIYLGKLQAGNPRIIKPKLVSKPRVRV